MLSLQYSPFYRCLVSKTILIQTKKQNKTEKARKLSLAKFLNPNNKSIFSNSSQDDTHFVIGSLCLATDESSGILMS